MESCCEQQISQFDLQSFSEPSIRISVSLSFRFQSAFRAFQGIQSCSEHSGQYRARPRSHAPRDHFYSSASRLNALSSWPCDRIPSPPSRFVLRREDLGRQKIDRNLEQVCSKGRLQGIAGGGVMEIPWVPGPARSGGTAVGRRRREHSAPPTPAESRPRSRQAESRGQWPASTTLHPRPSA